MSRPALIAAASALLIVILAAALTAKFKRITDDIHRGKMDEPTKELVREARAHPTPYSMQPASYGGTGKMYMGREIAQVMGHQAISWLERPEREDEEAPSLAIQALDLKPDAVIADVGAGSGYYTFRLAPLVPEGQVVAIDIQPEMVRFLENKEKELGFTNVAAHLGTIEDAQLPPNSLDAALFVDAYHEFSHPREIMTSLVKALRPGGRVFLLEYRAEDPEVKIKTLHKMSQEQCKKEMAAVGLHWLKTEDFLPIQHFMIFEKR